MAKDTSISLDDHFVVFIDTEIASGRYHSASEVVRAGLRLLEERSKRQTAPNEALAPGEASGTAHQFDRAEFVRRLKDEQRSRLRSVE